VLCRKPTRTNNKFPEPYFGTQITGVDFLIQEGGGERQRSRDEQKTCMVHRRETEPLHTQLNEIYIHIPNFSDIFKILEYLRRNIISAIVGGTFFKINSLYTPKNLREAAYSEWNLSMFLPGTIITQ
jgi:hypothetical protein